MKRLPIENLKKYNTNFYILTSGLVLAIIAFYHSFPLSRSIWLMAGWILVFLPLEVKWLYQKLKGDGVIMGNHKGKTQRMNVVFTAVIVVGAVLMIAGLIDTRNCTSWSCFRQVWE